MHNYISNEWRQNPVILEESQLNATAVDVFSRLMADRIIYLGSSIYEEEANVVVAQLLYLNSQSYDPIQLYINSPGGCVRNGMAIYDTMKLIKSPVHTVCAGYAASMASVLLSGGDKRGSMQHSSIMIHQVSGGTIGQVTDMEITLKEAQRCKVMLSEIIANNCNQPLEKVVQDMERDYWMNPYEAKEYGLIDEVFDKKGIL
jgi:ATP-dependent Clp protease protease subunit